MISCAIKMLSETTTYFELLRTVWFSLVTFEREQLDRPAWILDMILFVKHWEPKCIALISLIVQKGKRERERKEVGLGCGAIKLLFLSYHLVSIVLFTIHKKYLLFLNSVYSIKLFRSNPEFLDFSLLIFLKWIINLN